MAPRKCTACFVTIVICLLTCQTQGRVVRIKRQDCPDGTHDQGSCCNCGPGQKLKKPCTELVQTECELCEGGKEYQSHANYLETCEPCSSCSQINANLEVDQHCTPYKNTVCKCKKNHYCSSGTQPCQICEPCQECGTEGVKEACSATTNTICKGSNATAITLGVLIPLALVAACLYGGVYMWKKRQANIAASNGVSTGPQEEEPFIVNLRPHIADIAKVIQWKLMRDLAMKSGMSHSVDTCKNDYPNDSLERTILLLEKWVEKEAMNASEKLIGFLKKNNENAKAEEVKRILTEAK